MSFNILFWLIANRRSVFISFLFIFISFTISKSTCNPHSIFNSNNGKDQTIDVLFFNYNKHFL